MEFVVIRVKTIALACMTLLTNPVIAMDANQSIDDLAETLNNRWSMSEGVINWQVNDSHQDHLEFSGEQISAIIYYGANDKGQLTLNRKVVWPMLRTIPNDTHASLIHDFPLAISPQIKVDGRARTIEKLSNVSFDGILKLQSQITKDIQVTRTLSPSTTKPVLVENFTVTNKGSKSKEITVSALNYQFLTDPKEGVYGVYKITATSDRVERTRLAPGQSLQFSTQFVATKQGQQDKFLASTEIAKRSQYLQELAGSLQLETPDPVINQMFDFAKVRAAESIFRTKGGLMHGPGGSRYYAAIWANDQAEYINPFFPFLGDDNGNESAINSYRHFARFMNDKFEPIPSSIIAEGIDIWNGAGDRGDCAMIAYGASRFALSTGDKKIAQELLPLIDWCLEFGFRKMNDQGVIASDSDELEGRFPSGDYNLSTNILTYGALKTSTDLNKALGRNKVANTYLKQAKALAKAIENYFGANVQGYETYRYFEGNKKLRAWIALPLTVGIFDRKQGTLEALLSSHLWSENGIYSEAGNKTFWDRATLYAFRGLFAAQETDTAMRYFKYYSRKRLLGEHVPYAVEAWPEGDQRHLSAESALYARVVTEGIFGIEPTGFNSFDLAPYLPSTWNNMCLNKIKAFATSFDVCVKRLDKNFEISVTNKGRTDKITWDGQSPINYRL